MLEPQVTEMELESQKPTSESAPSEERQKWVSKYLAVCREYQVTPSADIVTCFKNGTPNLKLYKFSGAAPFQELDLLPLMDTFEAHPRALSQLKSINFANAKLGPSGTITVANCLSSEHCRLETLNLARQLPGQSGLNALLRAVRLSKSLKHLNLVGCWLGDAGAQQVMDMLQEGEEVHGLHSLDLENNGITFEQVNRLEALQPIKEEKVKVNLLGNKVLDEVLNAISHGAGIVLACVGTVFMSIEVRDKPSNYHLAVVIYSISLFFLYTSSTLYHSFSSLGPTVRHVFSILDHAAIYFLIAGSYVPFVLVHLDVRWILWAQLFAAFLGIGTTAFYSGKGKACIETTLYLVMGWSAALYIGDLQDALGDNGAWLLILGGLLYTGGVPFFIREKQILGIPDHTTWHLFVLAASVTHFFAIYWYCLQCLQESETCLVPTPQIA